MLPQPYTLKFAPKPLSALEKMPIEISSRIMEKLARTKENPLRFFIRLKGRQDFKLRVGDYRVIADINQTERTIDITKVGHRKDVYAD